MSKASVSWYWNEVSDGFIRFQALDSGITETIMAALGELGTF